MPYARRTRVHQLTARQLHHLSQLQRNVGPTSVLSQVPTFVKPTSASPAVPVGLHPRFLAHEGPSELDESPGLTSRDPTRHPQAKVAGGGGGDAARRGDRAESTSREPPSSVQTGSQTTTCNKSSPSDNVALARVESARPSSRRSDSQTEFQIVQRGPHGNIVLLSNESPDAQPVELLSSSAILARDGALAELDDEWELLSYEDEDEPACGAAAARRQVDVVPPRFVAATA